MSGERYYTTKIWQRLSSLGFSGADALSTSMDPRGEPVISTWKRPCQKIQNGSEFPELVAQNFRNPQYIHNLIWLPHILPMIVHNGSNRPLFCTVRAQWTTIERLEQR